MLQNGTIFFYFLSTLFYFAYLFSPKNYMQQFGLYSLWAGFVLNLIKIAILFKADGFLICYGMSGILTIVAFVIAGAIIFLRYKLNLRILGVSAMPIATVAMIIASKSQTSISLEVKATFLKNAWVFSHVIAIFIGDAFFAIAFGMSLLFLLQDSSIKSKKNFFFFKRLPSLNSIDDSIELCIKIGFAMLTFGLIIGVIYAKIVWGKFWSWNVKELWSLITWFMYAFVLHSRTTFGKVSGKKSAIITIFAFCILIFSFFGVNLFMHGHHSQFIL